jgi:hypothetical protein
VGIVEATGFVDNRHVRDGHDRPNTWSGCQLLNYWLLVSKLAQDFLDRRNLLIHASQNRGKRLDKSACFNRQTNFLEHAEKGWRSTAWNAFTVRPHESPDGRDVVRARLDQGSSDIELLPQLSTFR